MEKCAACGSKAKVKRIELDYCKTCAINFDNRFELIQSSTDKESLEKAYAKIVNTIETRDQYTTENKQYVLDYFRNIYNTKLKKIEKHKIEKDNIGLVYEVKGTRGRTLEVYKNKVVIKTNVTLGSIITGNATDGKKTIYFNDVIGLQFKPCGALIGYLQLETASPIMNNEKSNFYNENTFTFEETNTSNTQMEEIHNYIDKQIEQLKNINSSLSKADEILKFKNLLDMGIINQEEFERKKNELLK